MASIVLRKLKSKTRQENKEASLSESIIQLRGTVLAADFVYSFMPF